MHEWSYSILETVKKNVEEIGIENFCGQKLDDLKDFTSVAKNIAEADYYYNIVKAMEESTYGVDYDETGKLYFTTKRDIDKTQGKMYYTETSGPIESAMKDFMQSKEMHDSGSEEDNTANMKFLEMFTNVMSDEVSGMVNEMSPAEKTYFKNRLISLSNKF